MSKITQPLDSDNLTPFLERLRQTLSHVSRGVVGLADELLILCREHGLQLDWHDNQCRFRPFDAGAQGATVVPLQKSVFRAILARVAALCNERVPNSVSPYGGKGELAVTADPAIVFRVAFTNTPDEQRLVLTAVPREVNGGELLLHGDNRRLVAE